MDKATRILAIPLTSASYPESMDDLLDTISFHWRDSNRILSRMQSSASKQLHDDEHRVLSSFTNSSTTDEKGRTCKFVSVMCLL